MDGAFDLSEDLGTCTFGMGQKVIRIAELIGHKYPGIFGFHPPGHLNALFDGFPDIAVVMDQPDLSSVLGDQIPALHTDGVGHDNDGLIAFNGSYKSQTDSLIAAGRLHNDGVLFQVPSLFSFLDHLKGDPGLDRTAYVHAFILYQDLCILRPDHPGQADHGCIACCFQYIIINHFSCLPHASRYWFRERISAFHKTQTVLYPIKECFRNVYLKKQPFSRPECPGPSQKLLSETSHRRKQMLK